MAAAIVSRRVGLGKQNLHPGMFGVILERLRARQNPTPGHLGRQCRAAGSRQTENT